jgi:hypothetical protein
MLKRRKLFAVGGSFWVAASDKLGAGDNRRPVTMQPSMLAGAIDDGTSHPLSSRFKTLAEAQEVFPHAKDLSDELDWCALQSVINEAVAQGGGAVNVPNIGRPYVLNRALTVDPNRVTLRGDGATLNFAALRDGASAIVFRAIGPAPYGHERYTFEGFELVGPGRGYRTTGFLFRTDVEGLSSRAMIRDCAVHGFFIGVQFGDRAYGIGFSHVSVYDCGFGVHAPYGLHDAGETISLSQCYVFNSDCCIYNGGGFDIKLFGCSLDYAQRLVWDNNGGIDFIGCRLEIAPPRVPPIHCNNGRVNMVGGFFLINGPHDAVHVSELFSLSNPGASLHLFSVMGWNWRTTTGKLTSGPGRVHWYEGVEINEVPPGIGQP